MPVFFGMAGLSTDLTILADPGILLLSLGLIAVASLEKFAGAFLGGEIGGLTRREAIAVGCGMNARGSTEIIVATIGLSLGALSETLYTMIVTMAVVTTMAMPPMLRWSLSRVPLRASEKKRLQREEAETKEFVPSLERLLLAVDDGPNGRFTSHLAGLLAGRRGMPITVLPLGNEKKPASDQSGEAPGDIIIEEAIKGAAERNRSKLKDDSPAPVEIILRKPETTSEDAITTEAKKGYDLLFIGKEKMQTRTGAFSSDVDSLASAFDGPLAIAIAAEKQLDEPSTEIQNILVPLTGTEVSRRAAELAFSVARAGNVTVLYVAQIDRGKTVQRRTGHAREILRDIVEMASRYGLKIRTHTVRRANAANAILTEAKKGKHDLMGVSRRPGEKLFFGDVAAAILAKRSSSILLLST